MTNAAHRLLWTVLALLLVAVGGTGLALSLGATAGVDPDAPLLGSGLLRWWRAGTPWTPLGAALVGLVLAGLGQRLIRGELRGPGGPFAGDLLHRDGRRPGRTRLTVGVLARALERDLVRDRDIRAARVVLTGTPARPDLWIQLQLAAGARTAGVRVRVDAAVRRFAATAGCRPAHLDVTALAGRDRWLPRSRAGGVEGPARSGTGRPCWIPRRGRPMELPPTSGASHEERKWGS